MYTYIYSSDPDTPAWNFWHDSSLWLPKTSEKKTVWPGTKTSIYWNLGRFCFNPISQEVGWRPSFQEGMTPLWNHIFWPQPPCLGGSMAVYCSSVWAIYHWTWCSHVCTWIKIGPIIISLFYEQAQSKICMRIQMVLKWLKFGSFIVRISCACVWVSTSACCEVNSPLLECSNMLRCLCVDDSNPT